VKCIRADNAERWLTEGAVYKLHNVMKSADGGRTLVELVDRPYSLFDAERFVLKEKEQ
jgi:hypothetical protein